MQKREKLVLVLGAAILAVIILGMLFSPFNDLSLSTLASKIPSAGAETFQVKSVRNGQWSDPFVWDKRVPEDGDSVLISRDTVVTYDIRVAPELSRITVQGSLVFSKSESTVIKFQRMVIERTGYLEIGMAESPIPSSVKVSIQMSAFEDPKPGLENIEVWGTLEIHGPPVKPTWTRLAKPAQKGETAIIVQEPVPWKTGDHIVITSTTLNPMESEENYVFSVSGNQVRLAMPLKYQHDGTQPAQAEVALLTRNVVLTSLGQTVHATGIIYGDGAKTGISYAEFSHLGGKDVLGTYPIHFHHAHESMKGTLVLGVSVWDSHNRFITIHDTDGITVRDSVGYKSIGHGFFLEDGNEMYNVLENNIAILTLPGRLRPDDGGAAGFWIQNPVNTLVGNVAVSAAGSGFDIKIPEKTPEVIPFDRENLEASSWRQLMPRQLKILKFEDNEAHSNRGHGVHLYRLNPTRLGGISWFQELKLWRNGAMGISITAAQANITNSLFFGNRMGNMEIEAFDMTITRSTILGELKGVGASPSSRYVSSPFGMVLTGTRVTIAESIFQGHTPRGSLASADVINQPRGLQKVVVSIINSQLKSQRTIVFGYPLNGDSYFQVINLNRIQAQSFTLYRYDIPLTSQGSQCSLDTTYMAIKCPTGSP